MTKTIYTILLATILYFPAQANFCEEMCPNGPEDCQVPECLNKANKATPAASDEEGEDNESFCREMCPEGDDACSYDDCMKQAGSTGKANAILKQAPAQSAAGGKGPQSSCCVITKTCEPGRPMYRDNCMPNTPASAQGGNDPCCWKKGTCKPGFAIPRIGCN